MINKIIFNIKYLIDLVKEYELLRLKGVHMSNICC